MIYKIEIGSASEDVTDFVVPIFVSCNIALVSNEGYLNDNSNFPQGEISLLLVKSDVFLDDPLFSLSTYVVEMNS